MKIPKQSSEKLSEPVPDAERAFLKVRKTITVKAARTAAALLCGKMTSLSRTALLPSI